MRFACLGSGSRGNASLLEAGDDRVLIDCGLPGGEVESRLRRLGVDPATIGAIVVTHEHGDHLRSVATVARRFRIPVWMTAGTRTHLRRSEGVDVRLFHSHGERISVGALGIEPFPVPHDAREPCQFLFESGTLRFGMLTDSGHITSHIATRLERCDALLLECNHDSKMLRTGPYPHQLQVRVGGRYGHLSNSQAASFAKRLDPARVRWLIAGHISEKNNSEALVRQALGDAAPRLADRVVVARQDQPLDWIDLAGAS